MKTSFRLLTFCFVSLLFFCLNSHIVFAQTCNLEIIHTNDLHGRLLPFKLGISDYDVEIGGVARRYTLIKNLKKKAENTDFLILDAGDIAQGTIFFNLYNGLPDMKFMNSIVYDAVTIGNHEFDRSADVLAGMIDKAEFPFLAANLKFDKKSPLHGKVKPYIIKDYDGCKVGIIGLVTPEVKIITNPGRYTHVLDPLKMAKKYIKEIDDKTDVIILLTHLGYKHDKALARKISNVDIIVGGHSHTSLEKPVFINDSEGDPVIIVQSGELGKTVGDLKVKVENDKVKLKSYKLIPVDSSIEMNKDITAQLEDFRKKVKEISVKDIGSTSTYINLIRSEVRTRETTGGNFIVDAIKEHFPDVDIVFHNGGGIRGDKTLPPGDITMLDIIEMHPFEDEVVLFDLTGKEIKATLERSVSSLPYSSGGFLQVAGLTLVADVSKQPQVLDSDYSKVVKKGHRIVKVLVDGKPIEDNKTYRVAANGFLVNGGNGFVSMKNNAKNIMNSGVTITDILEDYLKKHSLVSPVVEDRIKIINIPKYIDE